MSQEDTQLLSNEGPTTMAEQEHIPPTIPALHLPPGPYDPKNPPSPSSLLYTTSYPTPSPSPTQYLIKVQATALCRGELSWPEVLDPKHASPPIPGYDVSGIVLSTPTSDEHRTDGPVYKVGDEIFGLLRFDRQGCAADVALAEEKELAFKPPNVSAAEAASIPLSALTAWQALFRHAGLKGAMRDDEDEEENRRLARERAEARPIRVLVTNASGGVGVQVLQLLRSERLFGEQRIWVCGTCSGRNEEFVKKTLRADEVVDYTKNPDLSAAFKERGWEPVDLVMDCIGGDEMLKQIHSPSVVRDGGCVLSIVQPVPDGWGDSLRIKERKVQSKFFIVQPDGEALGKIGSLVERGEVKPFVERVFELFEGAEAMEMVEGKRARGKVVLRVNEYDR